MIAELWPLHKVHCAIASRFTDVQSDAPCWTQAAVFAKCLTLPLSGVNLVSLVTTSRSFLWRPIAGATV